MNSINDICPHYQLINKNAQMEIQQAIQPITSLMPSQAIEPIHTLSSKSQYKLFRYSFLLPIDSNG